MRWTPGDRSNVEDDRAQAGIGLGRGVPLGLGGVVVLFLLSWATGTNFFSLLNLTDSAPSSGSAPGPAASSPAEEKQVDFVDAVMKDVQDTWQGLLRGRYQPTRAVLFRDSIPSACGFA